MRARLRTATPSSRVEPTLVSLSLSLQCRRPSQFRAAPSLAAIWVRELAPHTVSYSEIFRFGFGLSLLTVLRFGVFRGKA